MSMKPSKSVPAALIVSGILFGTLLMGPPSHAGQATTLQPVEDLDVPEGSQIPEGRLQETEEKVREYKAQMREKSRLKQQQQEQQRQEQQPQTEAPKPNGGQQQ